jgi:heme/copper-type cytochrome/quinol oxidase subunit 4
MSTKLQKKQFLEEITPTISVGAFFIIVLTVIALSVAFAAPATAWVTVMTVVVVSIIVFAVVLYLTVETYKRHKNYANMRMY